MMWTLKWSMTFVNSELNSKKTWLRQLAPPVHKNGAAQCQRDGGRNFDSMANSTMFVVVQAIVS